MIPIPPTEYPKDDVAELALLGSILLDGTGEAYAGSVAMGVKQDSFTDEWRQRTWEAVRRLTSRSIAPELATVIGELEVIASNCGDRTPTIDILEDQLRPMTEGIGSPANWRHYASIVQERKARREVLREADRLRRTAVESNGDFGDLVIKSACRITELGASIPGDNSNEYARFEIREILGDAKTWQPTRCVDPGIELVRNALGGGFRVGGVCVVVGLPGNAKTTTTMQFALNAAASGTRVGIFSLEMRRSDVARLLVAQISGVSRATVARGASETDPQLADAIRAGAVAVSGLPIHILDGDCWHGGLSRSRMLSIVAEGCGRYGWELVVVDYLGLISKAPNETEYAADVANAGILMRLATENDVAVVAIHTVRKTPTGARGNRNGLRVVSIEDVAGAGRLAYDADAVLAIACEQDAASDGAPVGRVIVTPLKSRYSAAGSSRSNSMHLRWYPDCGRVEDVKEQGGIS